MMRNAILGGIAALSWASLAACGSLADETGVPDTSVEETGPVAPEEPEVEPNGTFIEIRMYTRDPNSDSGMQVFSPRLVTAQVGDTVTFVPADPTHQSSSIPAMLPEGAEGWEGEINEAVSYVLPKPGIYGYQCIPHYSAGMIGMIIVEGEGKLDNLEAAQAVTHPGLAEAEFEEVFAQARAEGLLR
jgi:pseudoazurin